MLKKQIEGSYLPQTIAGAYNEATWYQLLQLYAKNNFNAGSLYIDGGSPKTSGYPFQKYVGQTTALGAIDQQNGSDYYIWNTSGTPQSVSNWKKQIGIADPQKIQGATPRNYNYTVAGGDNNATLIADMKKRYTVDHNEQVETENIAQAQQIFVVEQNNGSITAPATKTIGSDTYNFIGWTDGDMNLTKTISSPTSNLAYTAQYHGKLRTGRPDLADTKNQRRLVTYGGASGNWGMVYESMGNIYLSFSGNGGIDWYNNETRLNTTLGTASNPTVSNLLMYNGTRPCILIAWVETVGGASTLHLQTLQMYGGNYWGWGFNADAGQDASNHRTLNQIELGSTGGTSVWNLRNDARPVVQLTQVGNAIRTYLAYEGTDDKLHAAFMTTPTADDDLEGSYLDRVGFDPYVRIASAYSAHYPAIITYPSSYGFPAKTYVYFLSGGYAAGRRIAAYDFDTKTESVLSNPNNDYTYSSLQGSVNPSNNTYGLVAEALGNDMTTLKVNYYFKPTYMGSSVPSLSTVFIILFCPYAGDEIDRQ
ncbi:MAG: hypothetical protein HYV29_08245 [Ignavibacteriales bacterium]|nr:hypothetical protein [Ignavibacteriales bacterium]